MNEVRALGSRPAPSGIVNESVTEREWATSLMRFILLTLRSIAKLYLLESDAPPNTPWFKARSGTGTRASGNTSDGSIQ
jgi:hypothetical protein